MRIIGHGIDAVEINRIKAEIQSPTKAWIEQFCSQKERENSDPPPQHYRYFAGRYAAKEALVKALGTGFARDITWRGIEILRDENGAPHVQLSDEVLAYSIELGIAEWFVSISYCGEMAIASVIATGE